MVIYFQPTTCSRLHHSVLRPPPTFHLPFHHPPCLRHHSLFQHQQPPTSLLLLCLKAPNLRAAFTVVSPLLLLTNIPQHHPSLRPIFTQTIANKHIPQPQTISPTLDQIQVVFQLLLHSHNTTLLPLHTPPKPLPKGQHTSPIQTLRPPPSLNLQLSSAGMEIAATLIRNRSNNTRPAPSTITHPSRTIQFPRAKFPLLISSAAHSAAMHDARSTFVEPTSHISTVWCEVPLKGVEQGFVDWPDGLDEANRALLESLQYFFQTCTLRTRWFSIRVGMLSIKN